MRIVDFCDHLDSLYPRSLSCEWDNDGLMCCVDENEEISKVLISLDATSAAIEKAAENGCDLLLTHHPMLFKRPSAVRGDNYLGRRIISSINKAVTVISLHTRLDAGRGGVNDCLVNALGFSASCSFGDEESPGLGRIVELSRQIDSGELALLCKERLHSAFVRVTGNKRGQKIGVVGGSGSDFIRPAKAAGCDFLITGECSYNAAQDAAETGLAVIEAGHFETEYPVCRRFARICNDLGIEYEVFDSHTFDVI